MEQVSCGEKSQYEVILSCGYLSLKYTCDVNLLLKQ